MANFKSKTPPKMKEKFDEYQAGIQELLEASPIPDEALGKAGVDVFKKRLLEQIQRKGWNKSEFAARAGISPQTVGNLIRGTRTKLDRDHLYLFAAILGCTPHYLVGLSDYFTKAPPKKEGEKPFWNPITSQSVSEHRMWVSLQDVAQKDPIFVDYIIQIIENNKIENCKAMLLAAGMVKERPPVTSALFHPK